MQLILNVCVICFLDGELGCDKICLLQPNGSQFCTGGFSFCRILLRRFSFVIRFLVMVVNWCIYNEIPEQITCTEAAYSLKLSSAYFCGKYSDQD